MIRQFETVQRVVAFAATGHAEDLSLRRLAAVARISPFHLHRIFSDSTGETPRQMAMRLRLGRAAAMLLVSSETILNIALANGFQSHEVFGRAFQRRFGIGPAAYRKRGFVAGTLDMQSAAGHADFTDAIARCVRLYHTPENGKSRKRHMSCAIQRTTLAPQPVVVARKRVSRSEISSAIPELLSRVFVFAQSKGIPLAGLPLSRYLDPSLGQVTIESGIKVAMRDGTIPDAWLGGDGLATLETLPGGPAAVTLHAGSYERLQDAYAAIEQWMSERKVTPAGPPWECYLTDPAEHPDPKDWKTEVYWPLQE